MYPTPVELTESVGKVATPPAEAVATAPSGCAFPGLAPKASVTCVASSPVSTLPWRPRRPRVTAGEMAEPAAVTLGCWTKTSLVAAPGVTAKADDVAVRALGGAGRDEACTRGGLVDRKAGEVARPVDTVPVRRR